MTLRGARAFAALGRLLSGEAQEPWVSPDNPSFDRLRRAMLHPAGRSPLDLALLLRQALSHETAQREGPSASCTLGEESPLLDFTDWNVVGLRAHPLPRGLQINLTPWRPAWLGSTPTEGVDRYAAAEQPKNFGEDARTEGDPFLAALGHDTYQSVGQRAAVRAALSTPPGATLAVGLATGEGKSLIFQLAERIGFTGQQDQREPGLVLVVTPTVALAIDQENSAVERGFVAPIAYRGGEALSNAILVARIDEDSQGLCVASPEAVCGPLRRSLHRAAERGRLRAIVIDEAHLVDGWGTGFRTEFQTLGGIRQELVDASPPKNRARTILLSATLTPATIAMLKTLFAGASPFAEVAAIRLRSEPDYWVAQSTTDLDRQSRVLEALHHVPRPAILYATRVVDAKAWFTLLHAAGFRSLRMVHGESPNREREKILGDWREGKVDLVVATSAFGLGIDYRHVRSVLHACVPETLDRFYQEVGRGGRDGRTCLSLVMPAYGDGAIAEHINQKLVIGLPRGRQRWRSMFEQSRTADGVDEYVVPLDVAPSNEPDDIDMRGERNSDWNARVLTLMARSNLIQLMGSDEPPEGKKGSYERIRILEFDHLREDAWVDRVEPVRRDLAAASQTSLSLMHQFLTDAACPATLFRRLYEAGPEAHSCSRCRLCRVDKSWQAPERPRLEPASPWPSRGLGSGRLASLLDQANRLLVFYDSQAINLRFRRRFGEILESLVAEGVQNLVIVGKIPLLAKEAQDVCRDRPVFVAHVERITQRRLPTGPELVLLAEGAQLEALDLAPCRVGAERIIVAPLTLTDPSRSGVPLQATNAGRSLAYDVFHARLRA
ncbi:protein DpdF [Mesorhizobium sp. M1329]|uniref:protein DpdF n=1 Tax=Mesorhizobium sp. M1329 TaxID=2957083 RepID=UPI00333C34F4